MTDSEKIISELNDLLMPIRREAKETNYGPNAKIKQKELYDEYVGGDAIEIVNYRGYDVKVWIKKR